MNPFRTAASTNTWVIPVSLLMLAVGVLTSLAWITKDSSTDRLKGLAPDQQRRLQDPALQEEYLKVQAEVAKLRAENTRLQNAVANKSSASSELNSSLQQLKLFAGLTEVEGPGISITLRDSARPHDPFLSENNIIHDFDVLRVVNELWNAGAEAVSVNNHRVGPGSNVRCVGSTILMDSVKIAPPIIIRGIGEPETMYSAVNMTGGVFQELRNTDPAMVQVETVKKMKFPAYAGSTSKSILTVPGGKS